MNKFEQVSSDGHQMSLAERGWGWRLPGLMSRGARARVEVPWSGGRLYSGVQCIMGNVHVGTAYGQTDTHL